MDSQKSKEILRLDRLQTRAQGYNARALTDGNMSRGLRAAYLEMAAYRRLSGILTANIEFYSWLAV